MKNSEIRKLTVEEIAKQIATEEETLSRLKFAHSISPVENPLRIRASRRLVATLKTVLAEKQAI
jgi:large subunit ribosomal protein L29